ncbi:hypothetical protein [Aquisphaera giovannonii]|uniref:hypothetical protein n=1 Tax=Aquisphaera giovannonii TaxID=406548 RepID=UPI0011DFD0DC|nr:hypothetical protein [Aquisphaera giovannonii]
MTLIVASAAAAPPAGDNRADRRPIPDPPRQGTPWTPPETRLPKFLVSATDALFAQGVADPRGCEYRAVQPASPSGRWGGRPGRGHAFVLPAIAGDDRRFAVGWDGILIRLEEVGPEADLEADVRARAEALRKGREAAREDRFQRPGTSFWRTGPAEEGVAAEVVAPVQVCLLLRLGRADLAERLFAAATPWNPDGPRPDLTDYGVSYLTLANEWADAIYVRGVDAHGRGDDGPALDAFRRAAAFRKLAEVKAAAMGFPRGRSNGPRGEDRPTYFPELGQLDALLADQERRAAEPPRGPIPGRDADPAARVAGLILNLDQIAEHQMSVPGSASPGNSALVRDLIAMGDPAVEPLLHALVRDDRLTRSISYGRGMWEDRRVSPTLEAIIPALDGLMKTRVPGITYEMRYNPDGRARLALAAAYRAFWEANRAVPLVERYYRLLADDAAADRWQEAASGLVAPAPDASGRPRYSPPGRTPSPPLGESIRGRRDPGVTALMTRRAEELARRANDGQGLLGACGLAATLARWDAPAAIPVLHAMMHRARLQFARDAEANSSSREELARFLARSTLTRVRAGDRAALDEYAAWIRTTTPASLEDARLEAFEPMWAEPDHPAIAAAARALFADPKSPWLPLTGPGRDVGPFWRGGLENSPLVRVSAFRGAVLAGLADLAEAGVVRRTTDQPGSLSVEVKGGQPGSFSMATMADLDELPIGRERPVRACDWLAWRLAMLDGTPRFELYWEQPRRDATIAAIAAFLRLYGDRYAATPAAELSGPFENNTRLAFPPLGRPATPADVAAGRALFSLEGVGGEARVVPLPEVPLPALWTTLEDVPLVTQGGPTRARRGFDRSGRVWQAEEVRVGDRWDRYFGFVGAGTLGRAPADRIEFAEAGYFAGPSGRKLDVRVSLADPPESFEASMRPASPLVAIVRLRNRTGLDQSVPTEFLRPGPDGGPSLRAGIVLKLSRSDVAPSVPAVAGAAGRQPEELTPTREARFTPGDAARTLGPAAAFEAFRLDLRDWFDLSRPGQYHLTVTFGDASGVGTSNAGELYFRLGE